MISLAWVLHSLRQCNRIANRLPWTAFVQDDVKNAHKKSHSKEIIASSAPQSVAKDIAKVAS